MVPRCLCFMRQEGPRATHDLLETSATERDCLRILLNTDARAALTAMKDWRRVYSLGLVLIPARSATTFGMSLKRSIALGRAATEHPVR